MSGPIIRYLNLSGASVGVFEAQAKPGHPVLSYRSGCCGCLETFGSAESPEALRSARDWAVKHSETCRALPQPDDDSDPAAQNLIIAQELISRAHGVTTSDDGMPRQMNGDQMNKVNTLTLLASALIKLSQAQRGA